MRRLSIMLLTGVLLISLSGCASLRTFEKNQYQELEYRLYAVGLEPIKDKKPFMAGALNILPGIGNAYLEQWGPFIGNLLLWPWSVIWGVPQAAIDANTINKQETLYYYQFGPGKQKLEDLEQGVGTRAVPAEARLPKERAEENRIVAGDEQMAISSYSEYYRFLHRTISGAVVKPEGAGSGTVNIAFILTSDGSLKEVEILESSAEDLALREAAKEAVNNSAPFPSFSSDMKGEKEKKFTMSIEFKR